MSDGGKGREGNASGCAEVVVGGKSIWGVGEKIRKITAGNIVSSGMAEYWGNRGGRFYVAMSHCNGRQAKEVQDNCPK